MLYKGFITMNDGTKNATLFKNSEAEVLRDVRLQMALKNHYYRRNGVDYGAGGKWITYEEEHGGLKELVVLEFSETNRKVFTEI